MVYQCMDGGGGAARMEEGAAAAHGSLHTAEEEEERCRVGERQCAMRSGREPELGLVNLVALACRINWSKIQCV